MRPMPRAIRVAAALLVSLSAAGAAGSEPSVDPRSAVGRIADRIEAEYFDPDAAARIASELRADAAAGRFDALDDPRELAAALTDRLRPEDAHFSVVWSPPEPAAAPSAPVAPPDQGAPARENHGFRRVEVLPGNVGLVELRADRSAGRLRPRGRRCSARARRAQPGADRRPPRLPRRLAGDGGLPGRSLRRRRRRRVQHLRVARA
jgi:hypothetical protein